MRKLITILLILCLLPAAALAQDDHLAGEQLLYNPDFSESATLELDGSYRWIRCSLAEKNERGYTGSRLKLRPGEIVTLKQKRRHDA